MSVSVMAKAILDALFVEVIKEAHTDAKAEGKKRAAKLNLMRAVRNSPEMNRIFGNYLFFSKERLKVDPLTLLTKRKREKAVAERAVAFVSLRAAVPRAPGARDRLLHSALFFPPRLDPDFCAAADQYFKTMQTKARAAGRLLRRVGG